MPAWTTPDGALDPTARLDPNLDVQVVTEAHGWARIRCSNGWEAWVDGRLLVPESAGPPPASAPAQPPSAPAPAAASAPVAASATVGAPSAAEPSSADVPLSAWAPVACLVVLLGSIFMPWFDALGFTRSGWELAGDARDSLSDVTGRDQLVSYSMLGLYAVAALAVAALVLRVRGQSTAVLAERAAGVLALNAAIQLYTHPATSSDFVGTGLYLCGVVAIALGVIGSRVRPRPLR